MPEYVPQWTETSGTVATFELITHEQNPCDFLRHYLMAAEWTDCNADHDSEDADEPKFEQATGWGVEAYRAAAADCDDFLHLVMNAPEDKPEVPSLLDRYREAGGTDEQMGHDFWLTRNGHGAGFWDRGLGKVGDEMSEAAKTFSERSVYVDSDLFLQFQ